MSNRFHNKWHRASHHTYKDPTIIDAGWDPIASPDSPFQGDFVLADGSGGTQIGELYSKIIHTTKLTPESPEGQDWNTDKIVVDTNLEVTENITGDGDLYVRGNTSGKGWLKIDKYGDFGEYVHIHGQNNDGYGLIVDKKAYVNGETVLNDKTYVNKNGLFVTGDSIFNDDLNVSGNETIGEYVHILGAYPTATETYGGCGLVVDKKAYVSGETILNDKTYVNQNGLFVTGDSEFADNLTIDKNLYVTGNTMSAFIKNAQIEYADITSADIEKIDIHVGEKDGYILSGGLTGDDQTKVPESYVGGVQNLYLSGEGLISDSYVLFNAETRLTDVLNVSGETTINNKLTIQRYGADITGAVVLHNSLSVSGKSHFEDEAEFLDGVKVSGDMYVKGALNVTGDSTFVDTYTTGEATISELSVTGNAAVSGTLDVTGKTTVSNEISAASNITTNENLYVSGGANISNFGKFGGYVYVFGNDDNGYGLVVEKKANIKGDTIIGGDLGVSGDVSFASLSGESLHPVLKVNGHTGYEVEVTGQDVGVLDENGKIDTNLVVTNSIEDGAVTKEKLADDVFLVETEWEDLVALREASGLIPGSYYRITDYVATTVQEDTQSSNNPFDIIVRADGVNKLNENAHAIRNADDNTHFVNNNLGAWELKYCLDNDSSRFRWADTASGKGVVYWLKDEFNNECYYDFKGIQFKRWAITGIDTNLPMFSLSYLRPCSAFIYTDQNEKYYAPASALASAGSPSGYAKPLVDPNSYIWCYTFDDEHGGDSSILEDKQIYNNKIIYAEHWGSTISLPKNVFFGDIICGNILDGCIRNNTFSASAMNNRISIPGQFDAQCSGNIIDKGFENNIFSSVHRSGWAYGGSDGNKSISLQDNIIANNFVSNTIVQTFDRNVCGPNCRKNDFGNFFVKNAFEEFFAGNEMYPCIDNSLDDLNGLEWNVFGGYCINNIFNGHYSLNNVGNRCIFNTFKGGDGNTIGSGFQQNDIGFSFRNNTIGDNFKNNNVGTSAYANHVSANVSACTIGNNCKNNYLYGSDYSIELGDNCQNVYVGENFNNCSFGNGCQNIRFVEPYSYVIFDATATYQVGDVVKYGRFYYTCIVAHQGDWDADHFERTTVLVNKRYVRYVDIGSCCGYIEMQLGGSTSSTSYYQNVELKSGVYGTDNNDNKKIIVDSNVNQQFHTTYQPADSRVISV